MFQNVENYIFFFKYPYVYVSNYFCKNSYSDLNFNAILTFQKP